MAEWKKPADDGEAMVYALRHMMRRRVLVAIDDAGRPVSPTELSRWLRAELPAFYGLIELRNTKQSRGSTEHFYALTGLGERALQLAEASHIIGPRKRGEGGTG